MRIAVWHNLPSGGGKRALYYHVRGLVERGHTVEAWCPPSADQSYLPLGDLIPEHVVPMDWRPNPHRSLLDRARDPRPDILRGHIALQEHSRVCVAQIARGGFDVLLANPCQYVFAPPIGRYSTMRSVLYLQEPDRMLYEALPELPWIAPRDVLQRRLRPAQLRRAVRESRDIRRLRLRARLELENARAFDTILVNSFFSRESVSRAYGLDARVCYLGVDTDLFISQHKPREDFVVGVGSVTLAKNVALVVEALARIPEPRPQLVWVGNVSDQVYVDSVTQLADRLKVPFELKVRVSDDELVDLLNRARVMAYAPRLEPFGFAPLEANACGLPVVAVAEGGLRETIVDGVNGLLVESDPQAIAAGVQRLISDPAYAQRLGHNGRSIVQERWSLSASLDRLERHLQAALASHAVVDASTTVPSHADT